MQWLHIVQLLQLVHHSRRCRGGDVDLIDKAQEMYGHRRFTMSEIAASWAVGPMASYHHITTSEPRN